MARGQYDRPLHGGTVRQPLRRPYGPPRPPPAPETPTKSSNSRITPSTQPFPTSLPSVSSRPNVIIMSSTRSGLARLKPTLQHVADVDECRVLDSTAFKSPISTERSTIVLVEADFRGYLGSIDVGEATYFVERGGSLIFLSPAADCVSLCDLLGELRRRGTIVENAIPRSHGTGATVYVRHGRGKLGMVPRATLELAMQDSHSVMALIATFTAWDGE